MSVEVEDALDYTYRESSSPFYLWTRLSPIDGTNSITLDGSSGQQRTFQIASTVHNWARSYLSMTITPSLVGSAGYFNHLRCDFPSLFQQMSLYSVDQGTELEQVNYVNIALNVVNRYLTPAEDMKSFARRDDTLNIPFVVGFQSVIANNIGPTQDGGGNNVVELSSDDTQRYFVAGGNNTATPVLQIRIPFSRFLGTLFSVDKDIWFNAITQLKLTFNPRSALGQSSTSATNPNAAPSVAIAQNVVITNLYLYLAEEKSSIHRDSIIKKTLSSGIRYLVNHLDTTQQQLTGNSVTTTYRYNKIMGSRLSLWFHTTFRSSELDRYRRAFNESSNTDLPFDQVSLDLDNSNLFRLLTPQEVFSDNADRLRKSCISSYNAWLQNWAVPQDYRGFETLADDDGNVMAGLDLSSEKQIQISYNVSDNNARTHVAVAVIQRSVFVDKNGPVLLAM